MTASMVLDSGKMPVIELIYAKWLVNKSRTWF